MHAMADFIVVKRNKHRCLLACAVQYNGLLCHSYQSVVLSTFEMKIISLAGVSDIFTLRYHEVHALEILVKYAKS